MMNELTKILRNIIHINFKKLLSKKNSKFNINIWKVFNKLKYEIYIITQIVLKLFEFDNTLFIFKQYTKTILKIITDSLYILRYFGMNN